MQSTVDTLKKSVADVQGIVVVVQKGVQDLRGQVADLKTALENAGTADPAILEAANTLEGSVQDLSAVMNPPVPVTPDPNAAATNEQGPAS